MTCLTSCQVKRTWTTRSVRSVLTPCWTTSTHSSTSQRTNARITSESIWIDLSAFAQFKIIEADLVSVQMKCVFSAFSNILFTIFFQAVPGAPVKSTGGGWGNAAGRPAAAEGGGGSSSGGTGDSGGAEGYCGWRPGPVQGPLPAARCRGAPVSGPVQGWRNRCWLGNAAADFYCFALEGIRKNTASSSGSSWS